MNDLIMLKNLLTPLLICLLLSACVTKSPVVVTNNNFQTLCSPLSLKKDETLVVKLPSSQFSGYKWKLEKEEENILQLLKNDTQHDEDSKSRIHREETVWEYKAIKPGKTTLAFTYQLAWDTDVQKSQRVECPVTVSNE
ncbi:hypothetical protein DM558_14735 [Entomomonas moraniae]|uniref:Proteinase inhibitor I42 chagasin domain-containing protein n=2 Tax=Entomomonas moraniae TaxID=2213226 RepID=A0A3Q9JKZ9_9GAMM|nr:hypothetical protein DM558_14735 [Entomomonas moraniae]